MVAFLAKRLGWGLAVLLSVGVLTFALARLVPADPASFLAGQNASTETVERIRSELGLDRPALEQFASYFTGILRGDLGQSIRTGRPVAEDLAQFLPATLELMIAGFSSICLSASAWLFLPCASRMACWTNPCGS